MIRRKKYRKKHNGVGSSLKLNHHSILLAVSKYPHYMYKKLVWQFILSLRYIITNYNSYFFSQKCSIMSYNRKLKKIYTYKYITYKYMSNIPSNKQGKLPLLLKCF